MAENEGAGAGTRPPRASARRGCGAAVALLYAPASGRETREYLGDKAREGARKATELYEQATGEQA